MPREPGKTETWIGCAVLLMLCVISAALIVKQSRFDPRIFTVTAPLPTQPAPLSADSQLPGLECYAPAGWAVMTPVERFDPETLSERIDGKAELYLSAGFVNLTAQRFVASGDADQWLEVFVYDMGNARNAFSVFSTQQRPEALPVELTSFAYRSGNSLFMAHGRFYLEVVAAADGLWESVVSIGREFVQRNPAAVETLDEMSLFPDEGLEVDAVALLAENAFGFEGLDNVFVARYRLGGKEWTAFLSRRADAEAARGLAEAYRRFLLENGGKEEPLSALVPDAWLIRIFDAFELAFVHGQYLAGVHEADTREGGEELLVRLQRALVSRVSAGSPGQVSAPAQDSP